MLLGRNCVENRKSWYSNETNGEIKIQKRDKKQVWCKQSKKREYSRGPIQIWTSCREGEIGLQTLYVHL